KSPYIVNLLPGLLISIVVMFLGIYGAEFIGYLLIKLNLLSPESKTPVSGIFVAIIIGIIIRNTFGMKDYFKSGISFAVKYALREGNIFRYYRLDVVEALKLGLIGFPLIVVCISADLFNTLYLTNKMKQSYRLGTPIACGTGICGVTAIMATFP